MRSTTQSALPFFLLVRDPSKHILSLQENKKYAENMVESMAREPPEFRPDHKFTVTVPKADNYFPIIRYKCGSELKPVPIVSLYIYLHHFIASVPNTVILCSVFKRGYDQKKTIGELLFR